MKNIHVLPTDKKSRLQKNKHNNLFLSEEPKLYSDCTNQNIYITNDEEIKEGDWFYNTISLKPEPFKACENGNGYVNCSKYSHYRIDCKKIILTDNKDLIADGVQAIDDEFLEWFVKNPNCEFVDVTTYHIKGDISGKLHYKIIIPKEETKQFCENCKIEISKRGCACGTEEPKQETLEEVAEKIFKFVENDDFKNYILNIQKETFIAVAKWQQQNKNLYSKEDMWKSYKASNTIFEDEIALKQEFEKWFNQFKKK